MGLARAAPVHSSTSSGKRSGRLAFVGSGKTNSESGGEIFLDPARSPLTISVLSKTNFLADILHNGGHGMNDQETVSTGPSRRDFLQGTGVAVTATALTGLAVQDAPAAEVQPAGAPAAVGPAAVKITLNVNGRDLNTSVEPRVTLLDALRNYLDVTGCKRVCDRATCGACTVMLDGKVVYACTVLAIEAQGKRIRTAESLFNDGKVDAVPAAFVRADAQQCGFCTPGFVVAMRAVLDANPQATPAEVEKGLQGNICRCGTYEQMRDAIYALCNQKRTN
jgi:xanthine dehydrogenase YagT iron-sulfur-binding subunit